MDVTESMDSGNKWTDMKSAADDFINTLLPAGNTTNRVAIITYAGLGYNLLCDWTKDAATAKNTYKNADESDDLRSAIDGTTTSGGRHDFSSSYNVTSPTLTGYTADKSAVTGTMPAGNVTETVTYTANTHKVTYKITGSYFANAKYHVADPTDPEFLLDANKAPIYKAICLMNGEAGDATIVYLIPTTV